MSTTELDIIPKRPFNQEEAVKVINYFFFRKRVFLSHICDFLDLTYLDSIFTYSITKVAGAVILRNGEVIWCSRDSSDRVWVEELG